MIELHFVLEVDDDWPPVSVEGVPVTCVSDKFRIETPPLFIKKLSVGDVIKVLEFDSENQVSSWEHDSFSKNSTVWLLCMDEPSGLDDVLPKLEMIGCQVVRLSGRGCYSINVPESTDMGDVDSCLAALDESKVAIAYPSFRHPD